MSSIRQRKIQALLQEELGNFFRQNARTVCLGAMVSVTEVRVAPDMSYAKVFLSIFGHPDSKEVHESIHKQRDTIRYEMGKKLGKSLRRIPAFSFHIDNSLDYAEEIENLLKD
ncbi:30S ribosome-binding factor RbfA [Crocinitomicaceae bacterium]|jgi:ribosome-binding factor A|nr:30S ribosome-binding factor RbfA [Crocinitomicaceae bacterium]